VDRDYSDAANWSAYAIGKVTRDGRFKVRRIVWGRLMAHAERRSGEQIARACIMIEDSGYGRGRNVILVK
jgi:hypothetical protein